MQCKEINDLVMKYFDGIISELEREMIIKHNEKCSSCAEEFALLREAIETIEILPEIEAPAGFELKVMQSIKNQGAYYTNPKIVALWLISILGLMVFAWNMVTFVAIPLLVNSGILIAAQNVIIYGLNFVSGILSDLIVTISVFFGKILVMRNVLLRDYVTAVTTVVLAFMATNLFFIYRFKAQDN
jgi:predicted anti-sigma-YlaC factor YlaD